MALGSQCTPYLPYDCIGGIDLRSTHMLNAASSVCARYYLSCLTTGEQHNHTHTHHVRTYHTHAIFGCAIHRSRPRRRMLLLEKMHRDFCAEAGLRRPQNFVCVCTTASRTGAPKQIAASTMCVRVCVDGGDSMRRIIHHQHCRE